MKDLLLTVKSVKFLSENTFEMTLFSDMPLPHIHCGQFLHMEVPNSELLLRRPFCISKYDDYSVTIYVVIVGKGTEKLSRCKVGEQIKTILPIGNGYTLEPNHKKVVLIGGGVGVAPLISVPKCYPDVKFYTYLGFNTKSGIMFEEDFVGSEKLTVCTADGSCGIQGFPTAQLDADIPFIKPDVILTCGTTEMMKAVAKISLKHGIKGYMSGESHMACGVGACLVCTCAVKQKDGTVKNMRSCVDGPVFALEDIIL